MNLHDRLTHDRTECFSHLLGTVGIFLTRETFGILGHHLWLSLLCYESSHLIQHSMVLFLSSIFHCGSWNPHSMVDKQPYIFNCSTKHFQLSLAQTCLTTKDAASITDSSSEGPHISRLGGGVASSILSSIASRSYYLLSYYTDKVFLF